MRGLLLLLLLWAGCGPTPTPRSPALDTDPDRLFIAALIDRTVQVKTTCQLGRSSGSSVVLGEHRDGGAVLATAAHVVPEGCSYALATGPALIVLERDEEADWAVLWAPAWQGQVPHTFYADPYLGMGVIAVGYPRQRYTGRTGLQVTRGHLAADYGDRYRVTASFFFGSSGGPVFDAQGRLVGLSVAAMMVPDASQVIDDEYYVTPGKEFAAVSRRFTKDFAVSELACKDGTPVPRFYYPNAEEVCKRAQALRDLVGSPLTVLSGYRTATHNQAVGGAKNSQHLTASALDLKSRDWTPVQLKVLYEGLIRLGVVPDGGIGLYKTFLHIDIGKPRRWEG